jgi:glycosyltransferase involved in cell wall biosynthesis
MASNSLSLTENKYDTNNSITKNEADCSNLEKRTVINTQITPNFKITTYWPDDLPDCLNQDTISFLAVNPNLGFIQWHINEASSATIKNRYGALVNGSKLILRVYDITDINFNGFNANKQFDINISCLSGSYHLKVDDAKCCLMIEIGLRFSDNRFEPFQRSNSINFNFSHNFSQLDSSGLYINYGFNRYHSSENNIHESHFNRTPFHTQTNDTQQLSVAVFLNECAVYSSRTTDGPIRKLLDSIIPQCIKNGSAPHLFTSDFQDLSEKIKHSPVDRAYNSSIRTLKNFYELHREKPFNCIQCHNWYSAPAAIIAASENNLPLIAVFHSLEIEQNPSLSSSTSEQIELWERETIRLAQIILVSTESIKNIILKHYGKDPDRIIIVADTLQKKTFKRKKDIDTEIPDEQYFFFAGEMTHSSGVDLVLEALPNVFREFTKCRFIFAGEGPLKETFKNKTELLGIAQKCSFPGHLSSSQFESLLSSCFSVLIPSRFNNSVVPVLSALNAGKPIIATHLASLKEVNHGVNGLLVYDNPGSICWGIKEMLARPLHLSSALNLTLMNKDDSASDAETIAGLYMNYWTIAVSYGKENYYRSLQPNFHS